MCSCADADGADAQAPLPPLPAPQAVPKPGPVTDRPYAPQSILPGGIVVTLYPPGSPYLKADKVHEAEVYNMSQAAPGRVNSIVNIHNPSIEIHTVDRGINTGAAVILAAGGGHNTLNVGSEAADFVPFFYNYGVNTVILRNRLRRDGYNPQTDEVYDAQQAIRMVRAYAKELNIDPNKIGIMGFSAGAELAAPAAVLFDDFDKKNSDASDPLAGISSRPDFVGLIYPGPTPFARGRTAPPIPRMCRLRSSPARDPTTRCTRCGRTNTSARCWRFMPPTSRCTSTRRAGTPATRLPDGSRMSGGLTDRNDTPYGTWQYRFIDWFRDLGFLQKPGWRRKRRGTARRLRLALRRRPEAAEEISSESRTHGDARGVKKEYTSGEG